jgi:hypothetical protein
VLETQAERIKTAVAAWVSDAYQIATGDMVAYIFTDDDEAERYVVVYAAPGLSGWQAVEVWLAGDAIEAINSLGEGAPPDGVVWPWPE